MARNVVAEASAWLASKFQSHVAKPVEYGRGGVRLDVAATIGRTQYETDNGAGLLTRHDVRDFIIPVASLALFGLPQLGDEIREALADGSVKVYIVAGLANQPHYQYADGEQLMLRIHAKRADLEAHS